MSTSSDGPRMARSSTNVRRLTAGLLVATCLSPVGASAQTWDGATSDYGTASNWAPAVVPSGAGATATFGSDGVATVLISSGVVAVDTFQFDSGAQAYTIAVTNNATLRFRGSGIVNDSANTQIITIDGTGSLQFRDSA